MTTKHIYRQTVRGFYYYWNREKATWYGGIDMATRYEERPRIDPPFNGDKLEFMTEAEARRKINATEKLNLSVEQAESVIKIIKELIEDDKRSPK